MTIDNAMTRFYADTRAILGAIREAPARAIFLQAENAPIEYVSFALPALPKDSIYAGSDAKGRRFSSAVVTRGGKVKPVAILTEDPEDDILFTLTVSTPVALGEDGNGRLNEVTRTGITSVEYRIYRTVTGWEYPEDTGLNEVFLRGLFKSLIGRDRPVAQWSNAKAPTLTPAGKSALAKRLDVFAAQAAKEAQALLAEAPAETPAATTEAAATAE
jgi:hypothetical protein